MFIDDDEGTDDAIVTHQTLIDTQEKLGALLDLMPTGLIIHQMQGILYANQQALSLLEQDSQRITGQHFLDYVNDDVRDECSALFMSAFSPNSLIRFPEIQCQTKSGKLLHLKVSAGHLPWEGTSVIQLLLEDITELKLQAEELRKLTYHDPLTNAYNRRYFIEEAQKIIQASSKNTDGFSLIVFDLDHFKKINDTHGHLAGDEALKMVSQAWHDSSRHSPHNLRDNDGTLCRIGGEEFAVYLRNCNMDMAQAVAERLRAYFATHPVRYDDQSFKITASFGITQFHSQDTSIDDLIRRADIALYRAKDKGRNRIEIQI